MSLSVLFRLVSGIPDDEDEGENLAGILTNNWVGGFSNVDDLGTGTEVSFTIEIVNGCERRLEIVTRESNCFVLGMAVQGMSVNVTPNGEFLAISAWAGVQNGSNTNCEIMGCAGVNVCNCDWLIPSCYRMGARLQG